MIIIVMTVMIMVPVVAIVSIIAVMVIVWIIPKRWKGVVGWVPAISRVNTWSIIKWILMIPMVICIDSRIKSHRIKSWRMKSSNSRWVAKVIITFWKKFSFWCVRWVNKFITFYRVSFLNSLYRAKLFTC